MPEATTTPAPAAKSNDHASRLLQGIASLVVEKAFADITVSDIVRAAGVSKRSFYEHFANKDACFLALYRAAFACALRTLRLAVSPDRPWQDQIEQGVSAYLMHLSTGQGLVRALFIDVHYVGDAGLFARREVMQSLADFVGNTVNNGGTNLVLSPRMAMVAVGGINELILQAIETECVAQLTDLTADIAMLVRRLTGLSTGA